MDLFANPDLEWKHFTDEAGKFDYPIDYHGAILNACDDGHIDLLYRWEPNKYCHFHCHVAETTSTILAGELHVTDVVDGKETGSRVRKAGDYAHKPGGDIHMERGGPEGALVMFNLYAPDGRLAQLLARDGTVLRTITMKEFA